METLEHKRGGKLWTGTAEAAQAVPSDVPRPQLLNTEDWDHEGHSYRAELTTYVSAPVCSTTPVLTSRIDLPDSWFGQLREAVDTLSATPPPSGRGPVITQDYVHRSLPQYVGAPSTETTVVRWSLAHGDLHWANLTAPELNILDWEGFGPAPHGFDAAHLHAYTLPQPDIAAQVRTTFADTLHTADGRLAELIVAAIIIQAADRDPVHARLAPLLKEHIADLRHNQD
ncbi:phosphotransferase [Spirillospora sp. NPDC052269]